MEAIAHGRFQRYGVRKVSQVLKEIRGKRVLEAEQILPSLPRVSAPMVAGVVQSAAANLALKAVRRGKTLVPGRVYIKKCWASMGPMSGMKRANPGPQGRATTVRKKLCHLTVVVSDEAPLGGSAN